MEFAGAEVDYKNSKKVILSTSAWNEEKGEGTYLEETQGLQVSGCETSRVAARAGDSEEGRGGDMKAQVKTKRVGLDGVTNVTLRVPDRWTCRLTTLSKYHK